MITNQTKGVFVTKKQRKTRSKKTTNRTHTDIILSCGFTFLEFLDLSTLNSLYDLDLYWKKKVIKYINKTKQEVEFGYANIDFFKQENIPLFPSTVEKCAAYGIRPPARAKGPFSRCLNGWERSKTAHGPDGYLNLHVNTAHSKI